MKRKLSQKEGEEVVTKGFLEDYIDSKDFVTKDWIREQNYATKHWIREQNYVTKDWITQQNYVTKDWAQQMFEKFEENITQHTSALMEFHSHQNQLIIDALLSRIERIERHVGLPSF